jgi:hypothetical protein
MSLRMNISGFNYSQMAGYFGSRNDDLKKQLAKDFQQFTEEPKENNEATDTLEQAVNIIELAVDNKVPLDTIKEENDSCCYVVNLFAHHGQEHILTDSCDWKMKVLWDMQEVYSGRLTARMDKFLRYFIDGRPIFGKKIQTSWSYYAYFLNSEAKELAEELKLFKRQFQNDKAFSKFNEFVDEFEGWISAILEKQKDMWFWAD